MIIPKKINQTLSITVSTRVLITIIHTSMNSRTYIILNKNTALLQLVYYIQCTIMGHIQEHANMQVWHDVKAMLTYMFQMLGESS